MRVRIALATVLIALLGITATATAVPPTPNRSLTTSLTNLVIPIPSPIPDAPPADARIADAVTSAPRPAILREPGAPPLPTLSPRRQPAPRAAVVVKPTPAPRRSVASSVGAATSTGHVLRGAASWYCNANGSRAVRSVCHNRYPDTGGFDAYAAAGPKLRAALGGGDRWRGRVVSVDGIRVKLVDWCQCYQGQSIEKLIDLYLDVFRRTGGGVTIRW